MSNNGDRKEERSRKLRSILYFSLSVLCIVAGAVTMTLGPYPIAAVGVAIIVAASAGMVGALLGFLFAIPRVLAKDTDAGESTAADPHTPGGADLKRRLLASNTNLERVSDWLTTMLVGVGLSQITSINASLMQFHDFLTSAKYCGQESCGGTLLPIVGPFILVFGAIVGFLLCYIYTRIGLSEVFHDLERDLMHSEMLKNEQAEAVSEVAAALDKESENPAYKNLIPGAQPSVDDSLNVLGVLLYRPKGYQEVIDLAGKLSTTSLTKRAEYWFYLAAAFGQKYHEAREGGADENTLQGIRDNAIDCARRAVAIDPQYRSRLWDIAQSGNLDDDLADLRDDRDFRALVGK